MSINRSGCPAAKHGTEYAYNDYHCRCRDARADRAAARRDRRHGIRRLVPAIVTHRQLKALAVAGYRWADIGHELGVTERVAAGILRRPTVRRFTAELVDHLYRKLAGVQGPSPGATRRAQRQLWLPREAWTHGDITDPTMAAEQDALVAWMTVLPDPTGEYGPMAHLLARATELLPTARSALGRRAHALYAQGHSHPLVLEGERMYRRDRSRRARGTQPDRWLAA